MNSLKKALNYIDGQGLYPSKFTVYSSLEPVASVANKDVILFSSNNYLNLATHPNVIKAVQDATQKYGSGSGGSRWISGTTDVHETLELEISRLKKREDALVFSSGYLTNIGVISALAKPIRSIIKEVDSGIFDLLSKETVILNDEKNHASIFDACRIAGVPCINYRHVDMRDLHAKLKRFRNHRKIIVTDGIFSMDGNIAPLPQIMELARKFDAITVVDDAHATTILGKDGEGTAGHFNLEHKPDIEIGTLNKSLAGVGGFAVANKKICRFLRIACRPYIFSAAMPPGVAAGIIEAIMTIQTFPELRDNLLRNIEYLTEKCDKAGLPYQANLTPIIPIIIGNEAIASTVSEWLLEKGYFVPSVRWPAVKKGEARLRLTVMANHSKEQIDGLVCALSEILNDLQLLHQTESTRSLQ